MKSTRHLTAVALLLVVAAPLAAQTVDQDDSVDLQQIRRLRAETEADKALTDDLRARILELYDEASRSLHSADNNRAAAASFGRDRSVIDTSVTRLRNELEKTQNLHQLRLPSSPTVAQAEDALARERARLSANRAALRNRERLAEDRSKSRNDFSQRLGELDLEVELLNDELRKLRESSAQIEVRNALRLSALARREATLSEIEMLRARLALIGDLAKVYPLETDLAQRRVNHSEELVLLLEEQTHELRVEKAREELKTIREQCRLLSERLPSLTPLTTEIGELADTLWSPDGIVSRAEQAVKNLDTTRHHQAQLNRIAELTSRKFEAYGHRGSVTRWWPDVPEDFPKPGTIAAAIQHLDQEIPEVEHRLIIFEQQRSNAHELARNTMLDLQNELGENFDPELQQEVRNLLVVRQDLLDELIQLMGRYSGLLVENQTASNKYLSQITDVERFLYSHILWSRSVPRPIIPRLRDIGAALKWLTSTEHWQSVTVVGIEIGGKGLLVIALLLLIVGLRQPIRRRLRETAELIPDPERDSLNRTSGALVLTLLLAAPLPLALYLASALINRIGGSSYWFASATALSYLALVAVLLELIRQIFSPFGLAEAHFGWPTHATRPLYRGLLLTETIGLPLLYVALHLAMAGMRLDSPDPLQLHNNSLGRVAFIASMVLFGISLLTMLRPEKTKDPTDQDVRVPWPRRFSEYAFPTAFLGAYPTIIFATLVPAILAIFGFYVTGMLLAYQMLRTILLALAVLVVGGLIHRWRIVNRNRSLLELPDDVDEEKYEREFVEAEKQVRQLYRFGVVVAISFGLFSIWSDALPMLQLLKRVQVLPRVQILEPVEDAASALGTPSDSSEAPAQQESDSPEVVEPGTPPVPGAEPTKVSQSPEDPPLTLWNILEAILAGLVALVLVRNLPGLIEMMLNRRTNLDAGARFAFSTLVRYSITIIGTIAVFGLLGVTWDKVQWLAAALTFGLGFGLQEIVANFVSGLILLVERPVRVGDVVTIGTLMGKVNRIQIRATTITLWDRSEMIVPNKEFITTKLVNWTLSDSKRRIEIPLRITYGTNLELVKKILVEAAVQHPSVLEDPPPHTLLLGFGDDAVNLELRFVVDFGQGLTTKDQVQMTIERQFREQGIDFALPKSEVKFVSGASPLDESVND